MSARVYLQASDGRSYAPNGGFHRVIAVSETHYFHTTGLSDIVVPAGKTTIEALRGFEYKPVHMTVDVPAGGERTVTLRLERLIDMPARGWYSGDTHLHDLHQGNFGLTEHVRERVLPVVVAPWMRQRVRDAWRNANRARGEQN